MNVEEILKTNKKMPLAKRTLIHVALVANKLNEEVSMVLKTFRFSSLMY